MLIAENHDEIVTHNYNHYPSDDECYFCNMILDTTDLENYEERNVDGVYVKVCWGCGERMENLVTWESNMDYDEER